MMLIESKKKAIGKYNCLQYNDKSRLTCCCSIIDELVGLQNNYSRTYRTWRKLHSLSFGGCQDYSLVVIDVFNLLKVLIIF